MVLDDDDDEEEKERVVDVPYQPPPHVRRRRQTHGGTTTREEQDCGNVDERRIIVLMLRMMVSLSHTIAHYTISENTTKDAVFWIGICRRRRKKNPFWIVRGYIIKSQRFIESHVDHSIILQESARNSFAPSLKITARDF